MIKWIILAVIILWSIAVRVIPALKDRFGDNDGNPPFRGF